MAAKFGDGVRRTINSDADGGVGSVSS